MRIFDQFIKNNFKRNEFSKFYAITEFKTGEYAHNILTIYIILLIQ